MMHVNRWRGAWWCALLVMVVWAGHAMADDADGYAPVPSSIAGDWLVESRDAVIHIEPVGDHYQGRILWQLHDTYGSEDGPELAGKVVTDRKNPNPALRSRPLTGLRLLWGLTFDPAEKKWRDGHVYNSDDGRTYNCWVRMLGPNRLKLHGYLGISLFGGSTVWTRVSMKTTTPPGQPPYVDAPGT